MSCSHTITKGRWVEDEDWATGEITREWVEEEISAFHDVDLHRYKCTRCGELRYYSGRARDHFEGKTNDPGIEESNSRYLNRKKR